MWVLAASKRKHGAQVTKQQLFLFILADHIQNLFINSHLVFFPFITDSVHLLRIKNRNQTLYLYDNFQFPYIQLFTFLSYRHKMGTGNMKLFNILKMQTYFFAYFFYWNKISLRKLKVEKKRNAYLTIYMFHFVQNLFVWVPSLWIVHYQKYMQA